jgi:glycosyltransferase involved in cell wall biosynthesis
MNRLLLALPLRAYCSGAQTFIDSQAHNGLGLWLKHFDQATLICFISETSLPASSLPIETINGFDRLKFIGLPQKWLPHRFLLATPKITSVFRSEIRNADHLVFAIGGLWGDWPSIGALVAHSMGRDFIVWTDHVESQNFRVNASTKSGTRKVYTQLTAAFMHRYERFIIKRARLGLFHGADCFDAYAGISRSPHLVHNVHIRPEQHISRSGLDRRLKERKARSLRIAYAGRVSHEKGFLDWIEAISKASSRLNVTATWFGDGPGLNKARATSVGLPITFAGSLPHDQLIASLKTFDAFVFCHKTLESPRCLIEALTCGLPLIGYRSPYPEGLIASHRGGVLVESNSPSALATAIVALGDESRLHSLSLAAKADGAEFTDEHVFAHRAMLVKGASPHHAALPGIE